MANNRIFYAIQQLGFAKDGTNTFIEAHGVQSVGITTNFNLENIFELSQVAPYDIVEQIPDVEVTSEKIIDGYPLLWHLATNGAPSYTLLGRSTTKTTVAMSVFNETQDTASGMPISECIMSGMVPSALTYTIPTDGQCTESITLVGNHKIWRSSGVVFSGKFLTNADSPLAGHVMKRDDVVFAPSGGTTLDVNGQVISYCTVLPTEVDGINSSGLNLLDANNNYTAHVQSITVSSDFGRDGIFELGRKAPYFRFLTLPVEVSTEIVVNGVRGDFISATEQGGQNNAPIGSNLKQQSIRIYLKDGTFITTGMKNKLSTVNYGGGDAGGGNVTCTYNYLTYNVFTVKHPADPTVAFASGLPE